MPELAIPPHLVAADRWLALGATSATNPLLQFLLERLFHPLGIRCEYVECEPITNSSMLVLPLFVQPTWRVDDMAEEYVGLGPATTIGSCYKTSIRASGRVVFTRRDGVPGHLLPIMQEFDDGRPLNRMIDRSRTVAAKFVLQSFEAACLPSSNPQRSALYTEDSEMFARQLWSELEAAAG